MNNIKRETKYETEVSQEVTRKTVVVRQSYQELEKESNEGDNLQSEENLMNQVFEK
jgi:hypothetical protein